MQHVAGRSTPVGDAPPRPGPPPVPDAYTGVAHPVRDGDHALPRITHRGAQIAERLARTAALPVAVVDLGEASGPVVHAASEEEAERFAALWIPPREPGPFTLSEGKGEGEAPAAHGLAVPVTLSGRAGWLALLAPTAEALTAHHESLLALVGELGASWQSERAGTSLWVEHLRAEVAFHDRIETLCEIGTLTCDLAQGLVHASPRAREILRHDGVETIADIVAVAAPHDRIALYRALTGQEGPGRLTLECEICPEGGRPTMARFKILPQPETGPTRSWIATVEDITEAHREREDLQRLAERDPVTGLFNRNRLPRALAEALADARAARNVVGLLLLSVGDLRDINEMHGYATGDVLLKFVAGTLKRQVRVTDEVLRVGSGEFAVLLTRAVDEDAIARRADAIKKALATAIVVGIHRIDINAALGFAVYPGDTGSGLDLFAAASYALNEATHTVSPLVRRFRPEMRERRERERRLIDEITRALRNDEFTPFFQPKVELETGAIVGFEALCRWRHPERGVLTPGAFYQALSSPVVSAELSDVSLVGSFRAAEIWHRMNLAFGHISVNLSATQLARPNLIEIVEDLMRRFEVRAADISFEVLENVLIQEENAAHDNLRALADAGFTIALDDFGTGFASLTHIREPYIREVKIDRSFVTHAGSCARDRQIVAAIVQMARKLGLNMVAEGIEDEETLRKLRAIGCAIGQGFVFAPALPFEEATMFLGRQGRIFGMLKGE